ncbi:hypothetical protein SERLA73DRAFT_188510 [Serpula lacrymans var. lacrymans S7.3]|uniref:Uncharacterized protein n=2 Tax=Serpula lacrymans var. lacrymans TaxID=341189 RepID=F8QBG6_SERL3|nr:uncharacterized protein SERLADRAFT_478645 [Serpula lacrymans var. lacrymans S7.9]EGN94552.1 hypothetical protein SERLA73DRAFT_188510 [Serpula lacrymans var. lacrymans S7.3]EGO20031.1 hypothetical protein SERLADRAFT_478645 [Serpula lacrymans var. lacrymans S7.9]
MSFTSVIYIFLHNMVDQTRVFFPKGPTFRQPQLGLLEWARYNDLWHFSHKIWLLPPMFNLIVALIEAHPMFHNSLNSPQYPVSLQLAIFLNRAGHYGNAAACSDIAE